MAETKKYLDLTGLTHYDEKIKAYIDAADKVITDEIGTVPAKVGETDTKTVVAYVDAKTAAVDNALAAVAKSGAAADVALADTDGLYDATTVEAALKEIAMTNGKIANAVAGENTRATGVEGALTDLTTEAKGTLVAAINEVDAHADAAQTDATSALTKIGTASVKDEDGKVTTAATGLNARIEDLEAAVGAGGSVDAQITAAINKLDKDDTAVAHQFVTEVDETDGVITVSRAALTADDIPDLTLAKITDAGTAAAANVATVAIGTADEATTALPTVAQVKKYVADEVADLEGAMHFIGTYDSLDAVTADTDYTPAAGDVIIVGTKEYVYTAAKAWDELGDEGLHVAKTFTIAGIDMQNDITAAELKTALDIDDLEAAVGTNDSKGALFTRVAAIETTLSNADTYTAITDNEIDKLFTTETV